MKEYLLQAFIKYSILKTYHSIIFLYMFRTS